MQCNAKPVEPFDQFNKSVLLSSLSKYLISLGDIYEKALSIAEFMFLYIFYKKVVSFSDYTTIFLILTHDLELCFFHTLSQKDQEESAQNF